MFSRLHGAHHQGLPVHPHLPALRLRSHEFIISISIFTNQNFSQKKLREFQVALDILFVCSEFECTDIDFREAYYLKVAFDRVDVTPRIGQKRWWSERWYDFLDRRNPAGFGPASEPGMTSATQYTVGFCLSKSISFLVKTSMNLLLPCSALMGSGKS